MLPKVGELVKWYELYADQIVKDVGIGIVMNVRNINYYDGSYKNKLYDVYRFQRSDMHAFIDYNIERLENKNG